MRRHRHILGLTALALTISVNDIEADEVRFKGEPGFANVRIQKVVDGRVRFRLTRPSVRTLEKPLADLVFVQITDALDLNRAERYVKNKQDLKAIRLYERAARSFNTPWQKALVHVRLVGACDRAGRFDRAVDVFVRLTDEIGPAALSFAPKNLPGPKSRYHAAALATINKALKEPRAAGVVAALEALRQSIQDKVGGRSGPQSADPNRGKRPAPRHPPSKAEKRASRTEVRLRAARLAAIEEDIQAERYAAARRALDKRVPGASGPAVPTALRLRAQLALATAKTREDILSAGVWAMRVVVGAPDDAEVPACLLLAARVHARIGRGDLAASLLQECRNHPKVTPEQTKQANDALAEMAADD